MSVNFKIQQSSFWQDKCLASGALCNFPDIWCGKYKKLLTMKKEKKKSNDGGLWAVK